MSATSDVRVNTPVSTAELERRWAAVRAAMARAAIDVLVAQANNDLVGGYVRYLTDVPATGYPRTVIFPADAPMTVIAHGTPGELVPEEGDVVHRGVDRVLCTNALPSAAFTSEYDTAQAVRALQRFTRARIGILGPAQMTYALGRGLEQALPNAEFVGASDLVDRIKAIKSPEEQDLIRRCARVQDEAMAEVVAAIRPRMTDHEVAAIAREAAERRGSEGGFYLCGSAAPGEPAALQPSHLRNREIQPGDVLALLIECNGPGGMYVELGRTFVFGALPARLEDEHSFALEAQRYTLSLLRPGAAPSDIWSAYNEFMQQHGRPPETRLHSHGQGYDLVERPLIRADESMEIAAHMNLVAHPTYVRRGMLSWICDNWLIGPDGPGDRVHTFPQDLIVVG